MAKIKIKVKRSKLKFFGKKTKSLKISHKKAPWYYGDGQKEAKFYDEKTGDLVFSFRIADKEWQNSYWIFSVQTEEKYKSKGYARECLKYELNRLSKDGRIIVLECDVNNTPAVKAYTNAGFKKLCIGNIDNSKPYYVMGYGDEQKLKDFAQRYIFVYSHFDVIKNLIEPSKNEENFKKLFFVKEANWMKPKELDRYNEILRKKFDEAE